MDRKRLLVALIVVLFLSSPSIARAEIRFRLSQLASAAIIGILGGGVTVLTFGSADIAFASQGKWLPRGWANAQMGIGGVVNLLAGIVAASTPVKPYETPAS